MLFWEFMFIWLLWEDFEEEFIGNMLVNVYIYIL